METIREAVRGKKVSETKRVPLGKYWLDHEDHAQYEGVAFEPGGPEVLFGKRLNLWQGFAVKPRPGKWPLTRQHIYEVLAAGDPKADDYILRWVACMFQEPAQQAESVLNFRGDEGTGKGIFGRAILDIVGPHASHGGSWPWDRDLKQWGPASSLLSSPLKALL